MPTLCVLAVALQLALAPIFSISAACDPNGAGDARAGETDKVDLNTLKNRTKLPSSVTTTEVADIVAFADQRDEHLEAKGVVVTGYLLGERHEGPESPNCHSQTRRDFHMWVAAVKPTSATQRMSLRAESIVVEPTPNMQDRNPTSIEQKLRKLVGKHIRVMGWLMYDPEHPNQLGKTRGTLWEVHPVMRIEVEQANGSWKKF
jgi:hypothetical protein